MNTDTIGCIGNTIITNSGKYLDFSNPQAEQIDLRDIALGLGRACRFAGQSDRAYSVAEHCVLGARTIRNPEFQLAFLLHDASEAYTGDIPKPLKNMLPDFRPIERRLQEVIERKFGVDHSYKEQVKAVDMAMLKAEKEQLFPRNRDIWHGFDHIESASIDLMCYPESGAADLWLNAIESVLV